MSKKHFDKYYNELLNQYEELKKTLNEFELMAMENIVPPEQIEEIKKTIQPVAESFNNIAFIKYLLDMPNKKSKIPRYKQRQKEFLKKIPESALEESVVKRNNEIIENLKNKE